ncbi:threonine/serine exporter family protein [Formosa sediminum]|uniref:Threonine/serine exporter family protein n=1 Tax=Formosa sediminum TaxID=2594004 RepID=A0A516GR76_9FLAO|nr:threonine/serine exporter family protein [Formosa sediminum]QDO94003.1 threonine/serine exporter family protein [Formosa sediminum]
MDSSKQIIQTTNLLLDIASLLMVSGANTIRVNLNIKRFADSLGYNASFFISQKSLIMTLYREDSSDSCTRVKNIPGLALNFSIISAISKVSWKALQHNWTLEQIATEIEHIKHVKRYPRLLVLLAVSLAGAGFCNIFKGDYLNMLVSFVSTFTGLTVLQWTHKKNYNVYLRIFIGSFIASSIAAIGVKLDIGAKPATALATSVLYLVPGVPLINSFTDFLDNNIINGLVRFTTGSMMVLAIALGLFISMLIFNLN